MSDISYHNLSKYQYFIYKFSLELFYQQITTWYNLSHQESKYDLLNETFNISASK